MKKYLVFLLSVIFLLITITSCSNSKDAPIEQDLNFLCSKECFGRLPGSPGNEKARDYIAQQFEAAGLVPMEGYDSYLQPYTQENVFDPLLPAQTLTAQYEDGSKKTFTSGVDFYPYHAIGGAFEGEVVSADETKLIVNAREGLFADQQIEIMASDYGNPKFIASKTPLPFYCSGTLFSDLKSAKSIRLEGDIALREATVDNVVGVLPGKDRTQAIIICAHFDFVGGYGDKYFPGALDNASGTATLLEIVRELSKQQLPIDVVFAAFNGEEMRMAGGIAFTETELPYKQMNAINLDVVGAKGADSFVVSGYNDLAQSIAQFFKENGFDAAVPPGQDGDGAHVSLNVAGIPAVLVTTGLPLDQITEMIHYPTDTVDKLDPVQIEATAQAVSSYVSAQKTIAQYSGDIFEMYREDMTKVFEQAATVVQELRPSAEEVVYIEVGGRTYIVRDVTQVTTPDAYQASHTKQFPTHMGDFSLNGSTLLARSQHEVPTDDGVISISVYYHSPEDAGQYDVPLNEKCPLPEEYRTSSYPLNYRNASGQGITLSVHARTQTTLDNLLEDKTQTDTTSIPGATIYIETTTYEGKEYDSQIIYDAPDLPYYLAVSKHDILVEISAEDLITMLTDAMPELQQLPILF